MRLLGLTLPLALVLTAPATRGDDAVFHDTVTPFLARHCVECHRGDRPKGDVRLDGLPADFADATTRRRWQAVLDRLAAGEMPPKGRPRPSEKETQAVVEWISTRSGSRRLAARRLNRVEYENTVRDLLGVRVDLKDLLPPDARADGFDNNAEALHISSFLLEKYLEAADRALAVAVANGPRPAKVAKRYALKDERHVKATTEKVFRHRDDGLVMFSSSAWQAIVLWQFYPPDRGKYRFRLSVSGFQSGGKPVVFRVDAGPMLMATRSYLVDYFDAPADEPTIVEFVEELETRSTIRILPYGLASAQAVNKVGADAYEGPGLLVNWVEVEGPLHDAWPPPGHRAIFGDLPRAPAAGSSSRDRVEVVSQDPEADAVRILRDFTRRAFRRAVTDDDIKPYLNLVKAKLAEKRSFEQAVRVGLMAVLVSPEFLFLREKPGKLDDFALASRLSYFLWSTMPDEELLALAGKGELGEPEVLRAQVERMLRSPRSAALAENFVDQWLGLRDIDVTDPSHILYPEFDDMLKVSMVKEARLFFEEVLRNDLSVTNFVASDFSMLNGRLARHYGIAGVDGWQFRKVPLPADSHRGGVLTMAGVLKVTANGTSTSPVVRGAWVLDRILGTPPPRPPADVAAVEPDTRGATTIRDQLARHRQVESCAGCHSRIDPPGFALESFDVIGGWREHYRTSGRGEAVTVDGRRMPYLRGPRVDPADLLADGRKFANIDELKSLLLEDKDQLARSLTEKLLTYATGASLSPGDRRAVEAMVEKIRERNYGLRSLVHEVVQSERFRTK